MIIFKAVLLSYIRYGDNDAILNCYSLSDGYLSLFLKGVYTSRSKKKAYLFPFNQLEITLNSFKQDKMNRISKVELLTTYYDEKDLNANCILMFSAEFLNQVLRNENFSDAIAYELQQFLTNIQGKNSNAHILLLYNILKVNGLLPLSSLSPFLNPESGVFEEERTHSLFDENVSSIWKKFDVQENSYDQKLSRAERNLFLESLLRYYSYHYDSFKIPNSYEVLKQVFE